MGKEWPLEILISRAEASDISQAERLINDRRCENLLADRVYDSNKLRSNLKEQGIKSVIAGGINRKQTIEYDKELYKRRNVVERFIGRIKEYRRIATRYDKTSLIYRAGVVLALYYYMA
jgi:transposase